MEWYNRNQKKNLNEVYRVGCLGKIVSFNETNDKRFIITLSGIIRFRIEEEVESEKLYREFKVNYSDFLKDLDDDQSIKVPNKDIIKKIKEFFNRNDYLIEFNELEKLNFDQMISTICMISPFSVEEKQKLIETVKIEDKISALEKIINFNLLASSNNKTIQ